MVLCIYPCVYFENDIQGLKLMGLCFNCLNIIFWDALEGVCTLQWPYMDVTMTIFHVFLIYKKINKIKFIEIKKGLTYLKLS